MLSVRCSFLPIASQCPASTSPGPFKLASGAEADLGTAAHRILTGRIAGQNLSVDTVAAEERVDPDELGMLVGMGWRAWSTLAEHFPDPKVENEIAFDGPQLRLTGHTDVLSVPDDLARIADFKTGYLDADHTEQIRGYGFVVLALHPQAQRVMTAVIRVREQTADVQYYTREELDSWYAGLVQRLLERDAYRPGSHCRYCPRGSTCPAKTALLSQALGALSLRTELPTNPVERGRALGEIMTRVKLLESMAEEVRKVVKAEVAALGGYMPTGDGQALKLVTRPEKQIVYAPAIDILREEIPNELLEPCISVAKTKVTDAVKQTAPHREKGARVRALMERLDQAGALTTHHTERLEVVKDVNSNSTAAAAITSEA